MAGLGSSGYDITKLTNLIRDYVNEESAYSRVILSNMVLDGSDLIDALDNAKLDLEEDSKDYEQLETKYKEFTNNIEDLIRGKEGIFVDKIRNILKENRIE